eukprot:CAMPEP_0176504116 /NCGR_PEP_ID=MMETSP0200_2-20121128/15749_1 /TAXON_ID=947934 /ORGANISM="Chaetoceros sp., Strain GSL56" /LENGTH=204 /DNA_ID=CAMNT_0017903501 /DNA_START=183 /DNA_END=794 /DNA_ORIENTATION=-
MTRTPRMSNGLAMSRRFIMLRMVQPCKVLHPKSNERRKKFHCPLLIIVFIACAGENDLSTCSNTTSSMLDRIMEHFESAVQSIFSIKSSKQQIKNPHLIFIGPKVEPWMEQDDLDARMSYFQLSERLRSCIAKLSSSSCPIATKCKSNSIFYLDSLTLFCGETSNKSVVGGQAIAQRIYFHEDELHLSQNGYEIWKNQVDDILS